MLVKGLRVFGYKPFPQIYIRRSWSRYTDMLIPGPFY